MGFPHLPRPPAPSLELWVQTFSCQKRPCGLEDFSSFVKRRRDRRFQTNYHIHDNFMNRRNLIQLPFLHISIATGSLYRMYKFSNPNWNFHRLINIWKCNFIKYEKRKGCLVVPTVENSKMWLRSNIRSFHLERIQSKKILKK